MIYAFDDYELDTQTRELRRCGVPIPLAPKVYQVLAYLLEHRDRLVLQTELLEQVWPDTYVDDSAIRRCIAAIRRALGEASPATQRIKTFYRQGYRFVTAVTVSDYPPTETRVPRLTASPPPAPEGATAPVVALGLEPPDGEGVRPAVDPTVRHCTACQHRNSATARFCGACGTPLVLCCPRCDHPVSPAAVFCSACGQRLGMASTPVLPPALPTPSGERKLVTVLYCAMAPAAPQRHELGLDASHSLMQRLYDVVLTEVQPYEGTIQHASDEGVLVLFGVPVAQEDHAGRAALAALRLQQRLHEQPLCLQSGAAVTLRIALHTGLVVVGELGGALQRTAVVLGEATTLALTLARQALPGTVVASASTLRLLPEDVEALALPCLSVDGQQTPIAVYQIVQCPQRPAPRLLFAARPRSPFVGRDTELAILLARLARVEQGRGQVVAIVGEPGMGKSRLLHEWSQVLQARQIPYLSGHCQSYGQAIPYLPWLEVLRATWGIAEADSADTMTRKAREGLQKAQIAPATWAPYLLSLLGLEETAAGLASLSQEAFRIHSFEALHQLLLRRSQPQPYVLAIENVHWIDATSEAYLAALVERLAAAALLLLVTFRPGYQPTWLGKSYATQIAMQPLQPHDSRRVVRAVLRRTPLAPGLEQQLLARAEGNPFFLEELSNALLEQRQQHRTLAMPDTIQAVLAARMDRLPSAEKRLLQMAAVLGTEVPLTLLAAIAGEPEVALQGALTRLHAAEFLYEMQHGGECSYTFKHVLTQEVAYGSLLQEARQALHRQIVTAIERLYADRLGDHVDRLAYHARHGAAWEQACHYLRQSGTTALARSAYQEAVVCFEQALEALAHLPVRRDTQEQAVDLRLTLRNALLPLGDNARSLVVLHQAEAIAEGLDDVPRLGWIACYRSTHHFVLGEYGDAMTAGQQALALAMACAEPNLRISTQLRLGQTHHALGNYRQAIDELKHTIVALTDAAAGNAVSLVGLPAVHARTWLAWCLAETGAFSEGLGYSAAAVQVAETVERPYTLVTAYYGVGLVYLRQGKPQQALPRLERALALCQDADIAIALPTVAALLGAAYVLLGRSAEALGLLEQAVARATAQHILVYRALGLVHLGEAYLLARRLPEARQTAHQALEFCQAHQEHGHQAWALWLLGEIAARHAPPEVARAETAYRQACALAEARGMRPLLAHCHLGLGTLYSRLGDAAQARTALSTARTLLRSLDMPLWLPHVEATLAALGS